MPRGLEVGSGSGELTSCPRLCCAQLGDADLGGYTPAMQRGQMVSRGGLVSNHEVPGNVVFITGVRVCVGKVIIIMMDRAADDWGLPMCLTNTSDKVKFTEC